MFYILVFWFMTPYTLAGCEEYLGKFKIVSVVKKIFNLKKEVAALTPTIDIITHYSLFIRHNTKNLNLPPPSQGPVLIHNISSFFVINRLP
jgi:hypothetical protein